VAFAFLAPAQATGEVIDRVLAVVGGGVITLSDVNAATELGLVVPAPGDDPVGAVLAQLIDRKLQLSEVDRYAPPEPAADEVDREVAMVERRFASPEAFAAALARSGMDLAHLRQFVRENLRIRAFLAQRFASRDDRRQQAVDAWMAGLRRRTDVVVLRALDR
jgi:hypothetical protein